jgi:4-aminobutyrate aminotransferase-like enzyme
VLGEAHTRGLALLRAGLHDNVIRLLPPLTITDDELISGLDILAESVGAAVAAVGVRTPTAKTRNRHAD